MADLAPSGCGAPIAAFENEYWQYPASACGAMITPTPTGVGASHGAYYTPQYATTSMMNRCRWCRISSTALRDTEGDVVEIVHYRTGLIDFIGTALDSYIHVGDDETSEWARILAVNLAVNALLWKVAMHAVEQALNAMTVEAAKDPQAGARLLAMLRNIIK